MSELPTVPSRHRRTYLALAFGADDSGKVESIKNEFDRARCLARIQFEKELSAVYRNNLVRRLGSPDGRFDSVPDPAARTAMKAKIVEKAEENDAFYRAENRYPAIVRAVGLATFLEPFEES